MVDGGNARRVRLAPRVDSLISAGVYARAGMGLTELSER